MLDARGARGVMLLIPGLWFRPSVWAPWLPELNEAGYDATVLSWDDAREQDGRPDVDRLVRAAGRRAAGFGRPPIVIGHGVGGVVAERLLAQAAASAAISLAPAPGGYPVLPTAARLLAGRAPIALLGLRGGPVTPTFPQFRHLIANVGADSAAARLYHEQVAAAAPRRVLRQAARGRVATTTGPRRGPLLLAAGGKDRLISELSTARLHRDYRRRQPDAVTDYQVFPGLDHTLGLGTGSVTVLFHCLDWLTAHNM
jgi:non-heme chloroperoxidase